MRILYCVQEFNKPVPVEPGGLIIALDADETDLQEGLMRLLMMNAELPEAKQQLKEVMQYVTVTPQALSS